ncbi:MAG: gluconate 2-dehydrogenase subunit 3 family protein [Gemmatimonadaceae bacterium]
MGEKNVTPTGPMTEAELITRREAVLRVSAILGGVALVGGSALLTGCRAENAKQTADTTNANATFSTDDVAFLDEVADTILPTTSTPGAKAAKTGAFMALMVRDSYHPDDQKKFRAGMKAIDDASQRTYKVSFMKATPEQKLAVLEKLDRDQKTFNDAKDAAAKKKLDASQPEKQQGQTQGANVAAASAATEAPPEQYFHMMKELALLGYFTSEIGMTQAQRYVESPGRYDPCVPYKVGEKAWAGHA